METWHKPDLGTQENVHKLEPEAWKHVEAIYIDIADQSETSAILSAHMGRVERAAGNYLVQHNTEQNPILTPPLRNLYIVPLRKSSLAWGQWKNFPLLHILHNGCHRAMPEMIIQLLLHFGCLKEKESALLSGFTISSQRVTEDD
eukprot:bmy_12593T0